MSEQHLQQEQPTSFDELAALIDELAEVRASSIGRPVADAESLQQAQQLCHNWKAMARMHTLTGEARGVAVLDTMLRQGIDPVLSAVGADIERIVPECMVGGRWRVDRAVFHKGGRVSLIEVKDGGTPRDVLSGLGQVLFYKAVMERTTSHSPITPMLAVLDERDADLERACELAGVVYLPLGGVRWTRTFSELVSKTICAEVYQ